uniref:Uncharacterized protein n=1 Tax=Odontella aurita TaxID=265563 RepID=A0A7S4JZE9_9STRA|mmetsp:Transcript_57862/g.172734  ORF Transcript_57862/g.172734 Transcript_57862/m.172734 type:complete len:155 (+) Transcript_57862:297-761(+)
MSDDTRKKCLGLVACSECHDSLLAFCCLSPAIASCSQSPGLSLAFNRLGCLSPSVASHASREGAMGTKRQKILTNKSPVMDCAVCRWSVRFRVRAMSGLDISVPGESSQACGCGGHVGPVGGLAPGEMFVACRNAPGAVLHPSNLGEISWNLSG